MFNNIQPITFQVAIMEPL